MASKSDIFISALAILAKYNVPETKPLYVELKELLEPKKGGNAVDINEIAKLNETGQVLEIKCSLSGVWLPATTENFYNEKDSKLVNVDGIGLSRHSREGYKVKSDFAKTIKASKDAITADVMNEVITPAEGKERMAALPTEPDYSMVGKTPSEAPVAE